MKPKEESPEVHVKECLAVTEQSGDPDYYYLAVECGTKLFGGKIIDKVFKEALYMSSVLYKKPYEKGHEDGKIELVIRMLTKKFGNLSKNIIDKLSNVDESQLDLVADNIFDIVHLEDAIKLLNLSDIASVTKKK